MVSRLTSSHMSGLSHRVRYPDTCAEIELKSRGTRIFFAQECDIPDIYDDPHYYGIFTRSVSINAMKSQQQRSTGTTTQYIMQGREGVRGSEAREKVIMEAFGELDASRRSYEWVPQIYCCCLFRRGRHYSAAKAPC